MFDAHNTYQTYSGLGLYMSFLVPESFKTEVVIITVLVVKNTTATLACCQPYLDPQRGQCYMLQWLRVTADSSF